MPTLTIFAGINGAGKSTLYNESMQNEYAEDLGVRVNVDEDVIENGGDWRNFRDYIDASERVLARINYCIENQISFNWELTLITPFVLKIMRQAKENGFTINLNFIGVNDPELSIERIKNRVKNGGHGIEDDTVRTRHNLQFKNLKTALKLVNYALLYDNSKQSMDVVATYFDKQLQIYKPNIWLPEMLKLNNLKTKIADDVNSARIQKLLDESQDLITDELLKKQKKD